VIRAMVAMGGVADVNGVIRKQESRTLILPKSVEAIGDDDNGAVGQVGSGGDVEGVKTLDKSRTGSSQCNNIQSASNWIDHRSSDDANVAVHVGATKVSVAQVRRGAEIDVPVRLVNRGVVSIEGVDAVSYGGNVNEGVRACGSVHAGEHQRLAVDLVVDNALEEHAELFGVDVGRSERGLVQICAGAGIVVVLG